MQAKFGCSPSKSLGLFIVILLPPGLLAGDVGSNAIIHSRFSALPHGFERNVGQAGPEAKFVLRHESGAVLLTDQGAVVTSRGVERLRLRPIGANKVERPEGIAKMPEIANYFIGKPSEWRANVPTYERIRYENIYPGIDWVFRTDEGKIEYDFWVAPGADPSRIEIEFSGATRLQVTAGGDLLASQGSFEVYQHAPILYQTIRGIRRVVTGQYVIRGASRVGFRIGAFDRKQSLVIDPVLMYSGMFKATPGGIAVDAQGSAYLAGLTQSLSGAEVAYVYKLNPTGTGFVYSALVGGAGDSTSGATSIAVDAAGRAYVAGYTVANDFPTTPIAFQYVYPPYPNSKPSFVFGLNPSGTAFVYSTFLGGNYFDFATGIAIDGAGSAYVTGQTSSTLFPTTPGALKTTSLSYQTGFVTKLNASGTAPLYSTYLGGSGQMNGGTHDAGAAIAVDSAGNAYIVGSTTSPDFPLTPGAFETTSTSIFTGAGFVTKLNPSGSAAIYSTLIGGSSVSATGIAVDASGNTYVSGALNALDYLSASSIGPQGYGEAFVLKLNASGSAPVYLTKLGGSFEDQATAIAIDSTGAAYFTGFTRSSDFPVQAPVQAVKAQEDNLTKTAFVAKLDANGALSYSTYLGGQNNGDWGTGIAAGTDQTVYVTGRAGSFRFPITPGAIGDSSGLGFDTFVSAISTQSSCTFAASPLTNAAPAGGGPGSIDVTSQDGCTWVAVANRPWIIVGGNANGSGSGPLDYLVTPSTSPARTGQISVAGLKVDITQASGCIYSLGVNNVLVGTAGGFVTINNSASDSTCPWTVSAVPPWIQIPVSFQGSFAVLSNSSGVPRTARFTISGLPFVVNQTTSCGFATLSNPPKFFAQAGIGAVNFSSNSSCSWTAVSNAPWLHVSSFDSILGNDPLFGNGPGKLNFAIDANLSTSARSGTLKIGGLPLTIFQSGDRTAHAGVFRSGFYWLQDVNGDQQFTFPPDRGFPFGGLAGDIPITGDWNGSGTAKVGVYRAANGTFLLDYDGDGQFTVADKLYNLGVGAQSGDVPVVGDWNGNGKSKVGLFRQGFFWILDSNGDGVFHQGIDKTFAFGGVSGDIPVVGDWTGTGTSKIGLFRLGFYWILDANGNGQLDNVNNAGGDLAFAFGGIAGDVPVVGDWNSSGTSKVGVFRQGFFWVLDANGNRIFDGTGSGQDLAFPFGGITGDKPVVGRW